MKQLLLVLLVLLAGCAVDPVEQCISDNAEYVDGALSPGEWSDLEMMCEDLYRNTTEGESHG